jgi:hypothetical protein
MGVLRGGLVAAAWFGASGCARPPVQENALAAVPPPCAEEAGDGARADAAGEDAAAKDATGEEAARFVPDADAVRELQMDAMGRPSRDCAEMAQWTWGKRADWLDLAHEYVYCRLDNAVRWVDTFGLKQGAEYEYEPSAFRLNLFMRAGGRGQEKDFDLKVRFNAKMAFPRLEKDWYLFVDNTGRDSLPGSDPLERESDTRIGVSRARSFIRDTHLNFSGGVRLRSTGPVLWGEVRWPLFKNVLGRNLEIEPSVFYYSDVGAGQLTSVTWTRPIGERQALQLVLAEKSTESTDGLEFEQTFRYALYQADRTRGWVFQASVFPHLKSSEWYWDNAVVNLSWRDSIYRKWIYFTVTPQLDFAKEDDYDPEPSLRMGVLILFGGQAGDIL